MGCGVGDRFKSICVYCSSSSAVDRAYFDAAKRLGELIATRAGTLVFGGNCVGLMNVVAEHVHQHGGKVIGITPRLMHEQGYSYTAADELVVTEDMRDRKAQMEQRADALVALPGGFGTLEELFEILTGKHLGYHNKPIVLVNTAGFYDPLLAMFESMFDRGFAGAKYREHYHIAPTPDAALDYLASMAS